MSAVTPSSLVKYCSVDTALKILNSGALRWSAPNLFGDPFELDYDATPDFDRESFSAGLLKHVVSLIFSRDEPTGKNNKLITAICRWREEDRFNSEEEAEEVLRHLIRQMTDSQYEKLEQYLQQWRGYARSVRIATFGEKYGNLHCWQRFADNHRGLALRFDCGPDTALPHPQPVQYGIQPPELTSLREQVAAFLGRQSSPVPDDFQDKLLSKSKLQQTELEWRCFDREDTAEDLEPQLWYTDKPFPTHELRAVYLGIYTSEQHRDQIAALLKQRYPKTRLLQSVRLAGRYALDFLPA